ncbi:MAG: hypothetical protein Q8807_03055, partial ['Waltheria sp.' little leaf phytoplasma]|nr:hypothetical protein ['Waltheria sp.' little leaf phytoplasma]
MSTEISTNPTDLIRAAMESRSDAAAWTDAFVAQVKANPNLLAQDENELWGWMVSWFANAIMSCGHYKDEAAASLAKFRADHPDLFADDEAAVTLSIPPLPVRGSGADRDGAILPLSCHPAG